VFITYQSQQATEPVTYDVYPYGFIYHRGSLYLAGWAPEHGQVRHWKVDRIEAAELTPVHFQRPEEFNLQEHLAKSFGIFHGDGDIRVKIRFSPKVARYIREKTWHESQKLTPQPDSSLLAEFRLGSTEEIKSWALSFGKEAEVMEPTSLREVMAEELQTAAVRHSEGRVFMRDGLAKQPRQKRK
jgi:predicted DNA-binding transcriptional regulator YafY